MRADGRRFAEVHTLGCRHALARLALLGLFTTFALQAFAAPPGGESIAEIRARVEHASSASERVEALWSLADAQSDHGLLSEAERTLRQAVSQAATDDRKTATALRLAAVLSAGGKTDEARAQLEVVESHAAALPAPQAIELNQVKGALAVRAGDLATAETAFEAAATAAHSAGSLSSEVRARLNALRARMDRKELAGLEQRLDSIDALSRSLPDSDDSALLLLGLGDLYERDVREFRSAVSLRAKALAANTRAAALSNTTAARAYQTGLLGELYLDEGRGPEALRLSLEAVSLAQSIDAQDQLYRWEWQAARAQRATGEDAAAAESIDRALFTLSGIRNDVMQSSRQAFATEVEPVYLEYADVHLKQAGHLTEGSPEQQKVLRNVRDQLESLKQAEVQDYFDSGCAVSNASADQGINIPGTAVVYPVLLPDRLEVLIETGGTLRRFAAPVPRGEVTVTVRRFRLGLEQPSAGDAYRQPAQTLYKWLLADADPWLQSQKVNTLVFVPSGPLRTIPLSALMNGDEFLIKRYAVATTPAITLIPKLVALPADHILLAGLTKSVQGFSGLPSVDREIHDIGTIYPTQALEDETFRLDTIRTDLSKPGFSVAHLATHGEFSADHRQSFILTYDSRLTMDGLQAVLAKRSDPLDLLVLSACSTAAGDDRAALGLAGVAIQAGAKSALASLWSISDEATAALMDSFYKKHKAGGETKAESLREAQLALLQSPEYRHPSYWAPYLMIGNWL